MKPKMPLVAENSFSLVVDQAFNESRVFAALERGMGGQIVGGRLEVNDRVLTLEEGPGIDASDPAAPGDEWLNFETEVTVLSKRAFSFAEQMSFARMVAACLKAAGGRVYLLSEDLPEGWL